MGSQLAAQPIPHGPTGSSSRRRNKFSHRAPKEEEGGRKQREKATRTCTLLAAPARAPPSSSAFREDVTVPRRGTRARALARSARCVNLHASLLPGSLARLRQGPGDASVVVHTRTPSIAPIGIDRCPSLSPWLRRLAWSWADLAALALVQQTN